jgi:hypothetical protein
LEDKNQSEEVKEGEAHKDLPSSPPSMSNIQNYLKEEKYILKPKNIPHLRIKDTYYQIGKVLSFKMHTSESIANFKISENIVSKVFGSKNIMSVA